MVEKGHAAARRGRRQRARRGAGDQLREEILDAATDLLLQTGSEKAVSIRSVAQRVRVTPPSVYLHFPAKDELLNAVCARQLERLGEVMLRAATGHASAIEGLSAQGRAYVRWAVDNPELYRIALMGRGRPGNDVDRALTSCVFAYLCTEVQKLMTEGTYPQGDPAAIALELWAAAHGAASLLVSRPYLPCGDIDDFADRVMTAACWGHIMTPGAASHTTRHGWGLPSIGEGTQARSPHWET
ncbi:transcriptional regulator [Mycobacterium sp. JS623]|uniref:TetR/AcrR family transcriptional regulator n=1 Tax=Mycobacterium sp. JS623 TaxID=212767 RepID=UPI0002A56C84|nr:TetR/AcrR family transcriptional regulator [Mycobacterium sp. JS623]AGB24586.1 transcriptional regulator [Mycobacterium sp. JS623]